MSSLRRYYIPCGDVSAARSVQACEQKLRSVQGRYDRREEQVDAGRFVSALGTRMLRMVKRTSESRTELLRNVPIFEPVGVTRTLEISKPLHPELAKETLTCVIAPSWIFGACISRD